MFGTNMAQEMSTQATLQGQTTVASQIRAAGVRPGEQIIR